MKEKQNTYFSVNFVKRQHSFKVINRKVIERTTSIKFLGILLDEHLSWKNHISVVENKVSKNIGVSHKAKNIFTKGGLKTLYFSFVQSYLSYGNIAWGVM